MDKLKSSKLFLYLLNIRKTKNVGRDEIEIFKISKNDFNNLKLLFNDNLPDYNILNEYSNIIKNLSKKSELEKELIFLKEYFGLQYIDNSYILKLKNDLILFFIKKEDIYKDINQFLTFITELFPNNAEFLSDVNILKENLQKMNINLNIIQNYDNLLEKFLSNFKNKNLNQNEVILNAEKEKVKNLTKEIELLKENIRLKNCNTERLNQNRNAIHSYRVKRTRNSIDNIQPGEIIYSVQFISVDQKINYNIPCKNTDIFVDIEEILLNEYPEYKDKELYYHANSSKVKRFKTMEENGIKNNDDKIMVYIYDEQN